MIRRNRHGGGAQTNVNGLKFEQDTDLKTAILAVGDYSIKNNKLYYFDDYLGIVGQKNDLYKLVLEPNNINWEEFISKKLLPDDFLYLEEENKENKIYIVEKKFQSTAGSVDEKLQTCDFKLLEYRRLFSSLNTEVVYLYVLNDFFKHPKYRDVKNYIVDKECHYFFNEIPLDFLDLL